MNFMDLRVQKTKLLKAVSQFFDVPVHEPWNNVGAMVWLGSIHKEMADLGLMLAGGAVVCSFTEAPVKDLDFYMTSPKDRNAVLEFFGKYGFETVFESINAITLKRPSTRSRKVWTIQLITRFHGDPYKVMSEFDFTITQGCYSFNTGEFDFGERFFGDLAARKLVYLGSSNYPICAMYRTKKYSERGYKLPGSTIMHIALSIVRLEIKTYKDLKEQLMGIDTMYLQGLLNNDPNFKDELPYDYGQFVEAAFTRIDGFISEDEREEEEF
jgi:hypothetical protein